MMQGIHFARQPPCFIPSKINDCIYVLILLKYQDIVTDIFSQG
jgi:hypothetical protein